MNKILKNIATKETLSAMFDDLFKFKVNEPVRFKGDGNQYRNADMKLLVLARQIHEETGEFDDKIFKKTYHCRSAQFSGSGQIIQLSEKELISVDDFDKMMQEREDRRMELRDLSKALSLDIFNYFEVKKSEEVYLIKDSKVQKNRIYKVAGWSGCKDKGYRLTLTSRNLPEVDLKIDVKKGEFEPIKGFLN